MLERKRQEGYITKEIKEEIVRSAREGLGKRTARRTEWGTPNSALPISNQIKIQIDLHLQSNDKKKFRKAMEIKPEEEEYPGEVIRTIYVGSQHDEPNQNRETNEERKTKKEIGKTEEKEKKKRRQRDQWKKKIKNQRTTMENKI